MDPRVDAGKRLLGQHTVSAPRLSSRAAARHLMTFIEANRQLSAAQLPWVVAKDHALQDAALAHLKFRFTPLDLTQSDVGPSASKVTGAALAIAPHTDPPHRTEFLDEVVFNVAHPAHHRLLAPAVLGAIPAEQLENALVSNVQSDNELHVHNALHLFAELSQRRSSNVSESTASTQRFCDAAARLRQRPNLNPLIKLALEELDR